MAIREIDLLRVSTTGQGRALASQLGETGGEAGDALFPTSFAASGSNSAIRFADVRPPDND